MTRTEDMEKMRAWLLGTLLLFSAPVGAGNFFVPAREVAAVAEREIDGAEREVRVYLYSFSPFANRAEAWPSRLGRALGRARARGVDVEVVLESGVGDVVKGALAADFLKAEGVPVFFVDGPLLHAKALVVDGETVLSGSTNWTATAFGENAEANFLIRSTETAGALLAELGALKRAEPPAPEGPPPVRVPAAFLTGAERLGKIISARDEQVVDAFLDLLKAGASTTTARAVDLASFCEARGWPHNGKSRQKARVMLRRMRDNYHLIDLEEPSPDRPMVRMRELPDEGWVGLPAAYFDFGWPARLSTPAKVFYLIGLHQLTLSRLPGTWALGQERLALIYHVSRGHMQDGITELRRRNLIEVTYDDIPRPGEKRSVSVYRPNPFYDPAASEAWLAALEKEHGAERVARARAWAALVYEDGDVGAVEALIDHERRCGRAAVEKAAVILGDKAPDNPKRNIAYFLGTIRGMK